MREVKREREREVCIDREGVRDRLREIKRERERERDTYRGYFAREHYTHISVKTFTSKFFKKMKHKRRKKMRVPLTLPNICIDETFPRTPVHFNFYLKHAFLYSRFPCARCCYTTSS